MLGLLGPYIELRVLVRGEDLERARALVASSDGGEEVVPQGDGSAQEAPAAEEAPRDVSTSDEGPRSRTTLKTFAFAVLLLWLGAALLALLGECAPR